MAAKSSDLEDQTSGANLQTKGHTPMPSRGQKDPEEMGALGSAPSHLPSWSLARKVLPSCPNTRHCLGIHMTLTDRSCTSTTSCLDSTPSGGYASPWQTVLTKAIVMDPGRAVLFYGRWSLGEGLSLGEARDAAFTLTGAGTWVGKPPYLATDPLTIQEGQWTIAQAITECWIEIRGPGWLHLHLLTMQPFWLHHQGDCPWRDHPRDASLNHQPSPCRPQRGWDHDWHRRDQRLIPPQPPSPSLDCGFESDRSSVLTASFVSSQLDRLEGSQHSWHGRWCRWDHSPQEA